MKTSELTLSEREEISIMLSTDMSFSDIARSLKRDKGTISRETRRDGMNRYTYRAHKAHRHAKNQKLQQGRDTKMDSNLMLKEFIFEKLAFRWSPDQIAQTLKDRYPDDKSMNISHESIYTYIYVLPRGSLKKELLSYLRQQKKYRRRKGKKKAILGSGKGLIPDMISIEERPRSVENRTIPGHWEGDMILGKWKHSSLGTIVERTTRTVILVPLVNKDAISIQKSFAGEMKQLPKAMKLSLTYDQGKEMTQHKLFTKNTKIKVYFAHPAAPWERGTNENTNGLIRQFFPKGTDFNGVSRSEIKHVQDLLNSRPRKVLNYRTPYEVFNELIDKSLQ